MSDERKTPGQIAHEAFRESFGESGRKGFVVWSLLDKTIQRGWEAAAQAVADGTQKAPTD
jgi:hypothetical protein